MFDVDFLAATFAGADIFYLMETIEAVGGDFLDVQIARLYVEMQGSEGSGLVYEDYYQNKPVLGKVKLEDFAIEFAADY